MPLPTPTFDPILPDPPVFGIDPGKFPHWRPGQDHAVNRILTEDDKRFMLMVCPTGFGKSLMYVAAGLLSGGRTLILTSTNPLSHQIMDDFGESLGIVQVKGKANYPCRKIGHGVTCDKGPCNYGIQCMFKEQGGCGYYDKVHEAAVADIVVTNYAYWIYNNKAAREEKVGIGTFDLIVCDEAHDSPNKVADAYTVRMSTKNKVEQYLLQPFKWSDDIGELRKWATTATATVQEVLSGAKRDKEMERAHQASNAARKLKEVVEMCLDPDTDNIIVVPERRKGMLRVAVAWPFDRAQKVLFRGADRVLLTSATVRPKTATMLGVGRDEYDLFEYPHIIDQERRLLYHIPCVRMNYRTSPAGLQTWLNKADNIMRTRADRNGLFHTVSYARRDMVMKHSKHVGSGYLMTHNTRDARAQIDQFKTASPVRMLVSPSISTGYDFPYDAARYQIIGKIPFPDTSDPITKARCDVDKEYSPYVAMQTLVQTTGRIVRAADDWGETFIIDDNIKWFVHQAAEFAPEWFRGSYRSVRMIPNPPKL